MKYLDENKNLVYGTLAVLFVVLALTTAYVFVQGTIVDETEDKITFAHFSHDMDGRFADAEKTQTANVEDIEINVDSVDRESFYFLACHTNVDIVNDGATVFDDKVQDAINNDEGIEDKNLESVAVGDGYEVDMSRGISYTTTIYEDPQEGNIPVVDECYSTEFYVDVPIEWDDIDVDVEVDDTVEGDSAIVEVVVENEWQPLELNLTAEVEDSAGFESTNEMYENPDVGTTTYDFEVPVQEEVEVDLSGEVYLDLDRYDAEGVNINTEDTDSMKPVDEVSRVKIGSISGGEEVVSVEDDIETIADKRSSEDNVDESGEDLDEEPPAGEDGEYEPRGFLGFISDLIPNFLLRG